MVRTLALIALLLASSAPTAQAAPPCYDLGHVGTCPGLKASLKALSSGHMHSTSNDRSRRTSAADRLNGSSMGPRGMVTRCGGAPEDDAGHCR